MLIQVISLTTIFSKGKESDPTNMSADSWLTVKQQSAECEMTVGQLSADVLATVYPSSVQDVSGGGGGVGRG